MVDAIMGYGTEAMQAEHNDRVRRFLTDMDVLKGMWREGFLTPSEYIMGVGSHLRCIEREFGIER